MSPFNKILVPLDDGELSDRALDIAIEMAHRFDTDLVVVSVRRDPVSLDEKQVTADLEDVETEARIMKARIREHVGGIAPLAEGRISVEVRVGNVVRAIVDAAEENHIDLIVMGTHGRVGLADHLVGSTTERVQARVTASVLAVRPLGFPYLRD